MDHILEEEPLQCQPKAIANELLAHNLKMLKSTQTGSGYQGSELGSGSTHMGSAILVLYNLNRKTSVLGSRHGINYIINVQADGTVEKLYHSTGVSGMRPGRGNEPGKMREF